MKSRKLLFCYILLSCLFIHLPLQAANDTIKIDKVASWVVEHKVTLPETLPLDTIEGGVYYALIDTQIRVLEKSPPEFYRHYAELVVNRQGLESTSQLNIVYAPSYETLVFNSLRIHRDGKLIDKLPSARMTVIQREKKLENQLYDGRLTANIIIDDVRVNDIVEYGYTITGSNPVYNNIFAYEEYMQWSVPLQNQKLSILWGKSPPLYTAQLNTKIEIKESLAGKLKLYTVSAKNTAPVYVNSETPGWFDPYAMVFFTESAQWSDIAQWGVPLYASAIDTGPEVSAVAATISAVTKEPTQQIVQALKFVQTEIRYLGIEIGANSHAPSPAKVTLQRRYGDCKDKAVLFISLLKVLGIDAKPALVNTDITQRLAVFPPTVDAFNHVIVKVNLGKESYWLDPTRQYQQGRISDVYQPDYKLALVVDKQSNALEKMDVSANRSALIINDKFDLTKGTDKDVIYESITRYTGYNAEKQRYTVAEAGMSGLKDRYLDFYSRYYSSVEPAEAMTMTEDPVSGEVIFKEKYILNKFWKKNENGKEFNASFYANSILVYLDMPEQVKRTSPYEIPYPVDIQQNIDVVFDDDNWDFDSDEIIQKNKFFTYKATVKFDKSARTLHLTYHYVTHVDHVSVEDFDAYMAARTKARNDVSYVIADYIKADPASIVDSWGLIEISILSMFGFYILGTIFVFVSWRIDAKKQPQFSNAVFYPVSQIKLFGLSFVTFGIYIVYWFYRNWLYHKQQTGSSIMPVARGVFSIFWYYALYRELVKDSINRFGDNRVLLKSLAIAFAFIYLAVNLAANVDKVWVLSIVVMPLLLIPFVNYINHINESVAEAYTYNSRWLARHTILSLLVLPLMALTFASEFNITPSDKVVEGSKLMNYHIKFMHRKHLFPADEKIVYFYSDAFLDIQEDGNGFTDSHVFSYWKDDTGEFNAETAALSTIEKIDVEYGKNIFENTIITLDKGTGGNIVLYISRTDGLDKKFVTALNDNWHRSRKAEAIE